jgi:hypothetical protein
MWTKRNDHAPKNEYEKKKSSLIILLALLVFS